MNAHLPETIAQGRHTASIARAFAVLCAHPHVKHVSQLSEFIHTVADFRASEADLMGRGSDATARVKGDPQGRYLEEALKHHASLGQKHSQLQQGLPENMPAMDVSDRAVVADNPKEAVLCLQVGHFVEGERSLLNSEVMCDILSVLAVEQRSILQGKMETVLKEAGGFATKDSSWKSSLESDSDLEAILKCSKDTLAQKLKSADLKQSLEQLETAPLLDSKHLLSDP